MTDGSPPSGEPVSLAASDRATAFRYRLLFIFFVAVNGLGDGFKLLGEGIRDSFFAPGEIYAS